MRRSMHVASVICAACTRPHHHPIIPRAITTKLARPPPGAQKHSSLTICSVKRLSKNHSTQFPKAAQSHQTPPHPRALYVPSQAQLAHQSLQQTISRPQFIRPCQQNGRHRRSRHRNHRSRHHHGHHVSASPRAEGVPALPRRRQQIPSHRPEAAPIESSRGQAGDTSKSALSVWRV